jgi:recombination protein RecA
MAKQKESVDARAERLSRICETINKSAFGGENRDAVTWLGSRDAVDIERFPSGCMALDEALGGGWPKGRFVEIYGPESSGKSTLVLHAVAEHQKKYPDEDCGLVDLEYTFDENYAKKLGVNTKYLIVHQPDSGEQALNILKLLLQNGVRCIVFDSVAALVSKREIEGDIGDIHVAEQARMMSQALRLLAAEAGKRNATVLWTNQIRDKINISWGDKTTTPAGRALKHYASIRVSVRTIGKVKEGSGDNIIVVSSKHKADVKKNKCSAPFKTAEFCISFGHGVDTIAEILDTAISMKIVSKRGAWFSFDGEQMGQGRAATLDLMRKDAELTQRVSEAIAKAKEAGVEPEIAPDVEVVNAAAEVDADSIDAAEVESQDA